MSSADELLYDKVKGPDGVRNETVVVNEAVTIDYTVVTHNGSETWNIRTITVTSGGPPPVRTVIVDSNTVAQPPPTDYDYCG